MNPEPSWPADPAAQQGEPAYHFPVEVEVVGELREEQLRQVAAYVFDQLHTTLRGRG